MTDFKVGHKGNTQYSLYYTTEAEPANILSNAKDPRAWKPIPSKRLQEFMADGTIQIAPLAYMRGRTLDRAFVILDEAQNTSLGQLKMFLTRMGCDAKFIVTGDVTQIDLPRKSDSGLERGVELVRGIRGISVIEFGREDIVRHPLVTKIVDAFEKAAAPETEE